MQGIQRLSYHSSSIIHDFTQSLQNTGFVVLSEAPVDHTLIEEVYDLWGKFFLSDERFQYAFDTNTSDGYASTALSETAKGYHTKDIKAFYHLLRNGRCPKSTKVASMRLFSQLEPVAKQALSWIESGLPEKIRQGLSEPLTQMVQDSPNTKLRLIYYPPLTGNEPEGAVRAAQHADINLITLLPSATAGGLQVMRADGQWIDVICQPGDIIINAGDMLQMCTNANIRSTLHRVINPSEDENTARMSMPFFVHPRDNVRLSDAYTALDYRVERITENGLAPKEKVL